MSTFYKGNGFFSDKTMEDYLKGLGVVNGSLSKLPLTTGNENERFVKAVNNLNVQWYKLIQGIAITILLLNRNNNVEEEDVINLKQMTKTISETIRFNRVFRCALGNYIISTSEISRSIINHINKQQERLNRLHNIVNDLVRNDFTYGELIAIIEKENNMDFFDHIVQFIKNELSDINDKVDSNRYRITYEKYIDYILEVAKSHNIKCGEDISESLKSRRSFKKAKIAKEQKELLDALKKATIKADDHTENNEKAKTKVKSDSDSDAPKMKVKTFNVDELISENNENVIKHLRLYIDAGKYRKWRLKLESAKSKEIYYIAVYIGGCSIKYIGAKGGFTSITSAALFDTALKAEEHVKKYLHEDYYYKICCIPKAKLDTPNYSKRCIAAAERQHELDRKRKSGKLEQLIKSNKLETSKESDITINNQACIKIYKSWSDKIKTKIDEINSSKKKLDIIKTEIDRHKDSLNNLDIDWEQYLLEDGVLTKLDNVHGVKMHYTTLDKVNKLIGEYEDIIKNRSSYTEIRRKEEEIFSKLNVAQRDSSFIPSNYVEIASMRYDIIYSLRNQLKEKADCESSKVYYLIDKETEKYNKLNKEIEEMTEGVKVLKEGLDRELEKYRSRYIKMWLSDPGYAGSDYRIKDIVLNKKGSTRDNIVLSLYEFKRNNIDNVYYLRLDNYKYYDGNKANCIERAKFYSSEEKAFGDAFSLSLSNKYICVEVIRLNLDIIQATKV